MNVSEFRLLDEYDRRAVLDFVTAHGYDPRDVYELDVLGAADGARLLVQFYLRDDTGHFRVDHGYPRLPARGSAAVPLVTDVPSGLQR